MPKVSEEHKAAVRERLLDAALECLRERGYEATTTREILERAGLSAGALYHYFSSKDELIAALADRVFAGDLASLLESDEPGGDGLSIQDLLLTLLRNAFDPAGMPRLLYLRSRAMFDSRVRAALIRYDRLLVQALARLNETAQAEGLIRRDLDPEALVEAGQIFQEGLKTRQAADSFATSYERVVRTFLDAYAAGVLPEDHPDRKELRRLVVDVAPTSGTPSQGEAL